MSPSDANTLIATVAARTVIVIEAPDLGLLERRSARLLSTSAELGAKAIEFSGMANDDAPLVLGEWLSLQPSPPAL